MHTPQHFLDQCLNQPIWNAHHQLGSRFVFEIGEQVEKDRGLYHIVIFLCHWWLQQDTDKSIRDIVNSESGQKNIEQKVKLLNGKKILSIQTDKKTGNTIIDFNDNLFLKIAPYTNESGGEQWSFFTKKQIVNCMSDGSFEIEEIP